MPRVNTSPEVTVSLRGARAGCVIYIRSKLDAYCIPSKWTASYGDTISMTFRTDPPDVHALYPEELIYAPVTESLSLNVEPDLSDKMNCRPFNSVIPNTPSMTTSSPFENAVAEATVITICAATVAAVSVVSAS